MAIKIIFHNKTIEINDNNLPVKNVLQKLEIHPESYLIVKNGELITEEEILYDGDQIKLIAAISGG